MTRLPRTSRGGFTLIEMLVVITLLGVLLPMAGWMTFILLRLQATASRGLTESNVLCRAADSFRQDVHAARNASIAPVNGSLTLDLLEGRRAVYAIGSNARLTREILNGQRKERREEFRLEGIPIHFQLEGDRRAVMLQGAIRVEAVVGRDHRFEMTASRSSPVRAPRPAEERP